MTLTIFDASRLIVLMTTAPHPSSNALPQTLAFVPGGPEPMTNGLGSLIPSTVVASVGITTFNVLRRTSARRGGRPVPVGPQARVAAHQDGVQSERDGERDEPGVGVKRVED